MLLNRGGIVDIRRTVAVEIGGFSVIVRKAVARADKLNKGYVGDVYYSVTVHVTDERFSRASYEERNCFDSHAAREFIQSAA